MNMQLLAILVLCLGGCALAQQAPSLQYCDKVAYRREGRDITVTMHCFEAVESMLPLPIIPKVP